MLDAFEFVDRLTRLVTGRYVPAALHAAAFIHKDVKHQTALQAAATQCETELTRSACDEAKVAASVADRSDDPFTGRAVRYARDAAESASTALFYRDLDVDYSDADDEDEIAPLKPLAEAAVAAASAGIESCFGLGIAAAASAADGANEETTLCDNALKAFAEDVVQLLIELQAPGCQWLELTEA